MNNLSCYDLPNIIQQHWIISSSLISSSFFDFGREPLWSNQITLIFSDFS